MLGEASLAEVALAESPGGAAPIIPEVVQEGRQLVYVIELTLGTVADEQ